jgi:protein-S-isoprenylcysteine O-methyltransferase Ste14
MSVARTFQEHPMSTEADHFRESIDRRRLLAHLLSVPLVLGLVLFLPAGRWDWPRGWLFLLVFLAAMGASALYLWRVNPEIYQARSRIQEGTKGWDRTLLAFLLPIMLMIFPVAALDDGRFHWLSVPWPVCGLGYVLVLVGIAITAWAQAVNKFFEPGVRVQADRGHTVIDTGPYAIVRHPGYVAGSLLFVGLALSLGSYWALIPAGVSCSLVILRTRWEDRTLRDELAGYEDYVRRVRYRLVPGVW